MKINRVETKLSKAGAALGSAKSAAKSAAARENGRLGGRPPFFSARRAISDYRAGKDTWTGGALIVRCAGGGWQAIPGAYLTDISYTGSREPVDIDAVRAAAKAERHQRHT